MSPDKKSVNERRLYVRINKNFIIRFCQKDNSILKFEVSQIENISRTGICFTSNSFLEPGCNIYLELRTPYVTDMISLEGQVLDSHEKVKGLIYQNRLKFFNISSEAADILEKIENYNHNRTDYP